jgi:hypothetical protein
VGIELPGSTYTPRGLLCLHILKIWKAFLGGFHIPLDLPHEIFWWHATLEDKVDPRMRKLLIVVVSIHIRYGKLKVVSLVVPVIDNL